MWDLGGSKDTEHMGLKGIKRKRLCDPLEALGATADHSREPAGPGQGGKGRADGGAGQRGRKRRFSRTQSTRTRERAVGSVWDVPGDTSRKRLARNADPGSGQRPRRADGSPEGERVGGEGQESQSRCPGERESCDPSPAGGGNIPNSRQARAGARQGSGAELGRGGPRTHPT